jgi:hypothetical protein
MLIVIIMFIADIITKMSAFPFKLLQYAENLTELVKSAIKSIFTEIQNTGEWSFTFKVVKKSAKIENISIDTSNSSTSDDQTFPRQD